MGKGSIRRPSSISREEETLRWRLAQKQITFGEYRKQYRELKEQGKLKRKF